MATIREVAREAGVSIATVSRFLNGAQVKGPNAERIRRAVEDLGYSPNILGRSLTTNRSYAVGILVGRASSSFAGTLMGLLERELEEYGYVSLFAEYRDSAELLSRKADVLVGRRVDGLVGILTDVSPEGARHLTGLGVPLVVVDNALAAPGVDSVVVDNRGSVRQVVGAMLDAGHRRVGVLALAQDRPVGVERLQGWRDAHEERGLVADEALVRVCGHGADAAVAADELIEAGATALFACSHRTETGALSALARRRLAVGVDVGFAGFDRMEYGDALGPRLSSVVQPLDEMARVAASVLVGRMGQGLAADGVHTLPCDVHLTDSILGGLGDR